MKTFTYPIIPNLNIIFVFGSNTQGRHGKGSALLARQSFGAIYGQAKGLQGNSYAIITKDISEWPHKTAPKEYIIKQIYQLYIYAVGTPDIQYYIAYQGSGTNLNGYTSKEMAEMFSSYAIPSNIVFEVEFAKLLH